MNVTLDYLKSNRKWLVRDLRVWGDDGAIEADMLITETGTAESRIAYLREFSGGVVQIVNFADLYDHRGNQLPSSIENPGIMLISKNRIGSFLMGPSGPSSFRIARDRQESSDAIVDLLIMEMS
jgi:hypothetical protein